MSARTGRLCPRADGDAAPPGRATARAHPAKRAESARMSPQLAEAFARLPAYLGGHVAVSVTALLARACDQPAAGAARHPPSGACATSASGYRQRRADDPEPRAAGAVLSAAARPRGAVRTLVRRGLLRARLPAVGAGADALLHAAGAAEHHHRSQWRRSRHQGGRARRRHDAAAIARHGRAAAGAAGDHGRHPHRRDLGDRRRHAVDADRPDEPRQLHLHRPADAELGVRAVRLRRGGGVRAARRSTPGADGSRADAPEARVGHRRRARPAAADDRRAAFRRCRSRAPLMRSAPSPSPSNTCSRR